MARYRIGRPPIHLKTFGMPTKEEIEALVPGSVVKVIFLDEHGRNGERMWTIIESIDGDGWVKAKLDNKPICLDLNLGQDVEFHVTDVIDVIDKGDG